jgi:flavodoxin
VFRNHAALRDLLKAKGYEIVDEFSCRGYNTASFLKFRGGMNKGHPDEADLKAAEDFANSLL